MNNVINFPPKGLMRVHAFEIMQDNGLTTFEAILEGEPHLKITHDVKTGSGRGVSFSIPAEYIHNIAAWFADVAPAEPLYFDEEGNPHFDLIFETNGGENV